MEQLQKGRFYGQTNATLCLEGLTLTDTVYTHDTVDWHYHEHAYFTFILQGNVIEGNKKEIYNCPAGSLLFHNWQEPHYNIKPGGFTRGFHLEIEKEWFDALGFKKDGLQGSSAILSPDLKFLMYKIVRASKIDDASLNISVQSLVAEAVAKLHRTTATALAEKPKWATLIDEVLRSTLSGTVTLQYLSKILGVHPVHISRDFSKYFHCNLGEYIRKLKVEKALSLMAQQKYSFTEIAYECGFADQSHFARCFKEVNGLNPSMHQKIMFVK